MNDKGSDEKARKDIEHSDTAQRKSEGNPPAGPHAKDALVDHEKTPGSGSLPDDRSRDADVGPD